MRRLLLTALLGGAWLGLGSTFSCAPTDDPARVGEAPDGGGPTERPDSGTSSSGDAGDASSDADTNEPVLITSANATEAHANADPAQGEPSEPCMSCHSSLTPDNPQFVTAGIVYQANVDDERCSDCELVFESAGATAVVSTAADGSFQVLPSAFTPDGAIRIQLRRRGSDTTKNMVATIPELQSCAADGCHAPTGSQARLFLQ